MNHKIYTFKMILTFLTLSQHIYLHPFSNYFKANKQINNKLPKDKPNHTNHS